MSDPSRSTEQILTLLAEGPAQIIEYTQDLTEAQLQAAPSALTHTDHLSIWTVKTPP